MIQFRIRPSAVKGTVAIPPSKSHTLRAILFAAMASGNSEVRNFLHSPDATAMIDAMRAFGAKIEVTADYLRVRGLNNKLNPAENVVDSGNSGQVLRFVGALAALSPSYTVITGDHSIRHNRPVKPLLDALTQLGALAASSRLDGYAPIIIKGPMQSGKAQLPGEDSQPVSGMLIATSFLHGKTTIEVSNPGEKPWIDLTLHWLKKFGIEIAHQDYARYTVPGNARIEGFNMSIPGDFSSAAFPIASALVTNSELLLTNIDMSDCQGDKKLIEVLIRMGAKIEIDSTKKTLLVRKGSTLQGQQIDVNDFIDATPILSVIACFAEGKTEIINAGIARKKESDRLHAMATELKKMGASIEEKPDGLIISRSLLKGAHMDAWRDHRIAMSLSIAALGAAGDSLIDGAECISKTYPGFAHDFRALGAAIEVVS
ncbi:MAG: 3-phosphoshikimate 1-carboxyvinyltransferase [Verrucomicrobia bacterium]|nr:3-phosphoshikimate 1-carboxyvinyltransferase [Verrucomicrobiota bacterium]